jgi:hypothetical protein
MGKLAQLVSIAVLGISFCFAQVNRRENMAQMPVPEEQIE